VSDCDDQQICVVSISVQRGQSFVGHQPGPGTHADVRRAASLAATAFAAAGGCLIACRIGKLQAAVSLPEGRDGRHSAALTGSFTFYMEHLLEAI
jgi:hypothetical protein